MRPIFRILQVLKAVSTPAPTRVPRACLGAGDTSQGGRGPRCAAPQRLVIHFAVIHFAPRRPSLVKGPVLFFKDFEVQEQQREREREAINGREGKGGKQRVTWMAPTGGAMGQQPRPG